MPEMDGPQTALEICRICKDAKMPKPTIYCVTAYSEPEYREIALASKMEDLFVKPIVLSTILQIKAQL